MCSCICLIVKTHIVCITDYLLCLQVHLIYIRTYSMMYCVYVRTYVRTCVCAAVQSTYVRTQCKSTWLSVCAFSYVIVSAPRCCVCHTILVYVLCLQMSFSPPCWTSCLRKWVHDAGATAVPPHGGSHDCSTSGIERLWGLLWSACMYVRTYIPTSTPIVCLLAFWVAQRHMGVLSQSHSTHTYVRTCMYIVVAELYNSQACQISFTKSFRLSFCQNMCLEYCTNAYLVLTLGTFQTTIYLFSTIFQKQFLLHLCIPSS